MVSADHYVLCIECVTESMDPSKFCFRDINNFDTVLNHHLTSVKYQIWILKQNQLRTTAVDHSELQSHPVSFVHSQAL